MTYDTVIVDSHVVHKNGIIEKNNAETSDYNQIVQHVMIKYPAQYNQFIKECKEEGLISKGTDE